MSFEEYLGFITGMVASMAIAAVLLVIRAKKKKENVDFDERSALVRSRAGELSFYIALAGVFIGWVTTNFLAHQRGEAVEFFSAWGVMFWGMGASYIIALGYSFYLNSGEFLDGNPLKQSAIGALLILCGISLRIFEPNIPYVSYISIVLLMAGLVISGYTMGRRFLNK